MRIAVFTDSFLPSMNGIVNSIVNSSRRLVKRGHKIVIFTSRIKESKEVFLHKNIRIEYLKPLNLIDYPDFKVAMPHPRIIKKLIKFRPHIMHSHLPSLLGWEAVICSKIFDIPLMGNFHGIPSDFIEHFCLPKKINRSDIMKKLSWKYVQAYYNRCDIIITPSIAMKKEMIAHGIKKPIKILSNGVDLKKFYPKKIKKNGKTILHVGRISYEKNIDVLIKAFKIALKKHPNSKLLIAGKGPDIEKLKKEAGNYLNRSIRFLGPVPHEKLVEVYSRADIFATASTIESEGLVILEAMACSLPIIGVDALAIPYVVKHGKNGFIATPGNAEDIAKYILKLIENSSLRRKMGAESLKMIKKYSLDTVINELEEAYYGLK